MSLLRALSLVLLTALMTLTGLGTAMARGHMAADGVICGTGQYSVILAADGLPLFDAGGSPVEADALPCLDCVFGQMALISAPPQPGAVAATCTNLTTTPHPHLSPGLWHMGGKGRSPPHAV